MPNNIMKYVLSRYHNSSIWTTIVQDFRAMKKIIEDSKRSEWKQLLPNGFTLKQESEGRFGTYYSIAVKNIEVRKQSEHDYLGYLW